MKQHTIKFTLVVLFATMALVLGACQPRVATQTQPVPQALPTLAATAAPTGTTAPTATATIAAAMVTVQATATSNEVTPAASPEPEASPDPVAPGAASDEVKIRFQNTGSLGEILVDERGMTLYRFANDGPNVSNCAGECAVNWPPLLVAAGGEAEIDGMDEEGLVGTITRPDGSTQVIYKGQPLYYWINDEMPGDTTGQNVGGVWFVVNP